MTRASDRYVRDTDAFLTDAALRESQATVLPSATILVSMYGTIGLTKVLARPMATNQAIAALLPEFFCEPAYLYHSLQYSQTRLERLASQTTQPNISGRVIKSFRVSVPDSRVEQRRIAEVLDSADESIRSAGEELSKLDRIRAALVQQVIARWFGWKEGFVARKSDEDDLRKARLATVAEIADPEPGSSTIGPFGSNLTAKDYRASGVPVVFVRDIREQGFNWVSNVWVSREKARELSPHAVRSGDVVATKMGLPPGVAAVYPQSMPPGVVTADVIRIRPNRDLVRPQWLALVLNSDLVRRQVAAITGGVTRPKITLHDYRKIGVPLPELRVQDSILLITKANDARRSLLLQELAKLRQLKLGLMNDLLTGRVRVSEAEKVAEAVR